MQLVEKVLYDVQQHSEDDEDRLPHNQFLVCVNISSFKRVGFLSVVVPLFHSLCIDAILLVNNSPSFVRCYSEVPSCARSKEEKFLLVYDKKINYHRAGNFRW